MGFLASRQRMGAAAILLAISALLSRLMGLARDKIISWQFGASEEADLYFAAFVTPDIINYLLAGGFLSITVIPILGRLFQQDEASAWRFFSCIACWMFTGAFILTLAGELWAPQLAALTAPGFTPPQLDRLAFFTRIILPAQVFFLAGAPLTALLFLRRQFSMPALSPLIYNGCIILLGISFPLLAPGTNNHGMTGYCIGVTLGAFLGAFIFPLLVANKEKVHFSVCFRHPELKKFFIIALPLMLGQTVVMLDEQFLRVFGSLAGEGSVSILNYSRRLTQVPVSLVGQAAAVASYPFLVRMLANDDITGFDNTLNKALKTSLMLIIPCALWMMTSAEPIFGAIFEGGRFGPEQTTQCLAPGRIMLAATPIWVFYMILARAFYAWEDSLTPAITGTIVTILVIPAYYFLGAPAGASAIAAISSLSLGVYLAWLALIWHRRHGPGTFKGLGTLVLRSFLCSVPPAAAVWVWLQFCSIKFFQNSPFFDHVINIATSGIIFAIIFIFLTARLQPQVHQALQLSIERIRHKFSQENTSK